MLYEYHDEDEQILVKLLERYPKDELKSNQALLEAEILAYIFNDRIKKVAFEAGGELYLHAMFEAKRLIAMHKAIKINVMLS